IHRMSWQERLLLAAVLVGAVGGPFALNPFYVYPRYFMHLLPLSYVVGRGCATLPSWILGLGGIGLVAVAQPWNALPMVDLHGAASHCAEARAAGGLCAVGAELKGVDFYVRGVAHLGNLERSVPADATVLATVAPAGSPAPSFPGFGETSRRPGWEADVVFL